MRVLEETRENLATPTFTKPGGYGIGITQWHPAFFALGATLDICAAAYRKFCTRYQPKPKLERKNYWGSQLLAGLKLKSKAPNKQVKKKRPSPGQISL